MLLVKECNFFLYLFSLKIRPEIMFNNVLDRKETFFGHKNVNLSKSQKSHFSKGVKKRRKTSLCRLQSGHFKKSPNICIFAKGLTHDFGQKFEISCRCVLL